ncbi:MAG: O-antigen ligase family protein [Anaerolineales bacterium]
MDFSLLSLLTHLSLLEAALLVLAGALAVYFVASRRLYMLVFLLALSAALVGTTLPVVDNIASLCRWLAILLLLLAGILASRVKISAGFLCFWGYVAIGILFLFWARNLSWQLQRGVLLMMVALALPLAYSAANFQALKTALTAVAAAAAIYAVLNFISLPGSLDQAARYTGLFSRAPTFVIALGGLLPFALWGAWQAESRLVRIACGLGVLLGIITLVFSGQRAGTLAGLVSLLPFILIFPQRKTLVWFALLLVLLSLLTFVLLQQTSADKLSFLLSRYSLNAGLSYRDLIWTDALSEIAKNPFLGRGIGASETVLSYSFHNAYLEVWYNTGLLGLLLFLAAQVYFFYRIFYLSRVVKDPRIRPFLALTLGYMLGFVVVCLFESTGAGASNLNLILYLLLGVFLTNQQLAEPARAKLEAPRLAYTS